jgi:hypothetical protein
MSMQKKDRKLEAIEQMERELAEPLRNFRSAMTAVAEKEGQRTQNWQRTSLPQRAHWFQARLVMGLVPALLLLLLTVGLVMANRNDARHAAPAPNPVTAENEPVTAPGTARQQVSDSALFTEIDEDLSANVPQSMAPLEGTTASKTTHENTTPVEVTNGVEK